MELPQELKNKYKELKSEIKTKLKEFEAVSENQYFYELCFCICTPQSKAESAFAVQKILQEKDFLNNNFDVTPILREPSHYIRFHNQKALRLQAIKENWKVILAKIKDNSTGQEKRNWFNQNVKGIGMKESAHYLRNIGFKNLGILDRHILKHLITCRVFDEIPKISSKKQYDLVEEKFKEFALKVNIPMDELDLLFWSYEAGLILK
jgi:N-glycosylase/DNA lyase